MKNVLVFPCGSEIGLEVHRSLRFSKDFKVFGASSVDDHGGFVFDNYIPNVPFVDQEDFINVINKIITEYDIDFIIPTHDSVVLKLAKNANKVNAYVVTSPAETCEIARSKKKTYEILREAVKTPKIADLAHDAGFPLFLKPDVGQGSKGVYKVNSQEELIVALANDTSLLSLEYLPGPEYTVDCFTDKDGNLLFAQARTRSRIVNGISVKSLIVKDSRFEQIAKKINDTLTFRGVWFFQLKEDANNELTLLEIAPRVAGTMALSRIRGANLPLLSLYDAMGIGVSVNVNDFDVEIDRALQARYRLDITFDTVYIDFDDTLVIEESPNYLLIALIYKLIEQGKKIILITKHLKQIENSLEEQKISLHIFDKIISLSKAQHKPDYMTTNSIFIDDSFAERNAVKEALNIPVFDVSEAVELL